MLHLLPTHSLVHCSTPLFPHYKVCLSYLYTLISLLVVCLHLSLTCPHHLRLLLLSVPQFQAVIPCPSSQTLLYYYYVLFFLLTQPLYGRMSLLTSLTIFHILHVSVFSFSFTFKKTIHSIFLLTTSCYFGGNFL